MSAVSGYTLHLYCDNFAAFDGVHNYDDASGVEYTSDARNCKQHCFRSARKDGWLIGRKTLCPKCSGKKGKTNDET